jgi:uncharacterized membrane protein
MTYLKLIALYLGLAYATWFAFLAVMALLAARNSGKLTKASEVLAMPILVVGQLLDISLNVASTALFLDLPQEWMLTFRCDRYLSIANPSGMNRYRQRVARALCQNLLDPFQSGGHCRGIDP